MQIFTFIHLPQIVLEQHSRVLSSGEENCFSFLVSKLVGESLMMVAQVQHAWEDMICI